MSEKKEKSIDTKNSRSVAETMADGHSVGSIQLDNREGSKLISQLQSSVNDALEADTPIQRKLDIYKTTLDKKNFTDKSHGLSDTIINDLKDIANKDGVDYHKIINELYKVVYDDGGTLVADDTRDLYKQLLEKATIAGLMATKSKREKKYDEDHDVKDLDTGTGLAKGDFFLTGVKTSAGNHKDADPGLIAAFEKAVKTGKMTWNEFQGGTHNNVTDPTNTVTAFKAHQQGKAVKLYIDPSEGGGSKWRALYDLVGTDLTFDQFTNH